MKKYSERIKLTAVILAAASLFACGNSDNTESISSPSEPSPSAAVTTAMPESSTPVTTAVPTTDAAATTKAEEKKSSAPKKVTEDWGWYEIVGKKYADWTFVPGMNVLFDVPPDKIPSGTSIYDYLLEHDPKSEGVSWNYNKGFFYVDDPFEPVINVSTTTHKAVTGEWTVEVPDCGLNGEWDAVLYPDTLEELVDYMVINYEDLWGDIHWRYGMGTLLVPGMNLTYRPLFDMSQSMGDWERIYMQILCNNPYTYNVFSEKGTSWYNHTGETAMDTHISPIYQMTKAEYDATLPEFRSAWNTYIHKIKDATNGMSARDAAEYVARYICNNCEYDHSLTKRTLREGLLYGTTVCMGYTQWFNSTMNALGYHVAYIQSDSLNHIWSAVYFDDEQRWAEIDVTWMDPTGGDIDMEYFDFSSTYVNEHTANHYCYDQKSILDLFESIKTDERTGIVWTESDSLNVRCDPSSDSNIVGHLAQYTHVEITGEKGDWYEINYHGSPAFVSKQYIYEH